MKIIEKNVDQLIPYENNPRRNDVAVDAVAKSIENFGFKVPIVIDKNNVVVTGHTRLKASKLLGLDRVPCIVADDLTDEQIKAFRLADNKVAEQADWDYTLLDLELEDLTIDMEQFGFEFLDEFEHEQNQSDTQQRVEHILNLDIANFEGDGKYDIPILTPVYDLPPIKEWIGFNFVLSDDDPTGKAVHFFIDDYQFERIWNDPQKYVDKLKQYVCVATPDFSPYGDMPMATQIYNHYRKHWVGAFLQSQGVTVIPTIRASIDERSLDWYLDGTPKNSIVCISSMWTGDEDTCKYFVNKEYKTMHDKLQPKKVFLYGREVEGLQGNIERIQNFCEKRWDR